MSAERERILIVGLGNELFRDEGLGVHVTRLLSASRAELPPQLDILEAGTALFDVLPEMSHHTHVIFVDAIRMGREPGSIYRVELDGELDGGLQETAQLSLHQGGLFETIAAARLLNLLPDRLTLIGAEPERVELGLELSETLRDAAARIVSLLIAEAGHAQELEGGHTTRSRSVA